MEVTLIPCSVNRLLATRDVAPVLKVDLASSTDKSSITDVNSDMPNCVVSVAMIDAVYAVHTQRADV